MVNYVFEDLRKEKAPNRGITKSSPLKNNLVLEITKIRDIDSLVGDLTFS
jgi:hypothetical protein